MKVGFVNVVPWAGHKEHAEFLMDCARRSGHEVHYFSCGGGRKYCYQKLVNQRCFECQYCQGKNFVASLRGKNHWLRSGVNKTSRPHVFQNEYSNSVVSSVGSSLREEMDDWIDGAGGRRREMLNQTQEDFLSLTEGFCEQFLRVGIGFLFVFNGRFHDVAAAINAANKLRIPYASHERAWFGRGLQVNLNADCLSRRFGHFAPHQFSQRQLDKAKSLVDQRVTHGVKDEWRTYKQHRTRLDRSAVPARLRGKYLLIPSSRSEFLGHEDFHLSGKNSIRVLERFLEFYKINPQEIVVRGHPAWNSRIGSKAQSESASVYRGWCKRNGAIFIEPSDNSLSTYELMLVSKLGVLNGGSAVVEAVHLGLPCVALSKAHYTGCSFVTDLSQPQDLWPEALPVQVADHQVRDVYKYIDFRYRHQVSFFNNISAHGAKKYSFEVDSECLNEFSQLLDLGISGVKSDAAYFAKR